MHIEKPWHVHLEKDSSGNYLCSGMGITLTIPKPKPFVVIDGVVYINSEMIDKATIRIEDK